MEPVTHLLTGACLARAGLNRRAAYATAGMAIAADFPDIDTLWSLRGPVSGFEHHRGITHTLLGLPFEAAILVAGLVLFHRLRQRRQRSARTNAAPHRRVTVAPVRWPLLYGFLLLALSSHLLLDYTNNYGIRPFFPFNPHWYAASIVFIVDPLLFLFLLSGLLLPALFGLIGREVTNRAEPFQGARWARLALLAVVALWAFRGYEHNRALLLAESETLRAPARDLSAVPETESSIAPEAVRPLLSARRSLASPDPLNPFRWYTATDFGSAYKLGVADTRLGTLSPGPILNKPAPDPLLAAAEQSHLGRIYLDWSPMPWITAEPARLNDPDAAPTTARVTFEDVRFMGEMPWLHRNGTPPLTGFVTVGSGGRILEQGLDGKGGH